MLYLMLNLQQSIVDAKSNINNNNNVLHWKVSINTLIDAALLMLNRIKCQNLRYGAKFGTKYSV